MTCPQPLVKCAHFSYFYPCGTGIALIKWCDVFYFNVFLAVTEPVEDADRSLELDDNVCEQSPKQVVIHIEESDANTSQGFMSTKRDSNGHSKLRGCQFGLLRGVSVEG